METNSAAFSTIPQPDTGTECFKLTYMRNTICFWMGYPCNYVAGKIGLVLTGNLPRDNSLDGHVVRLSGHLVENNTCTMLFVDKLTPCLSE